MPQDTLVQDVVAKLQVLSKRIDDAFANISGVNTNTREKLSAARTYYVRTDGSDSNDGLTNTAAGAFLTIQAAVNVSSALDNNGYNITLQIADGTYSSSNITLKSFVGSGQIIIQGNTGTPSNVVLTVSSGAVFSATNVIGSYYIKDIELTGTGTASIAINVSSSKLNIGNLNFGTGFSAYHVISNFLGYVTFVSSYEISGGTSRHLFVGQGASLTCRVVTVTLTGTPNFSSAFLYVTMGATAQVDSNTYSGAATGRRYYVDLHGTISTFGAAETYLPGNALGSMQSEGIYDEKLRQVSRNTAQFDKANATLTDITGITATLLNGRTYKFRVILYTTSNIASGVKAAMSGSCTTTAIIYEAAVYQGGVLVAPTTSRATALGITVANVTAVTVATIIIDGTVTVNVAGTLTVQFADNAGVLTSSVLVGSNMTVEDITP